MALFHETCEKDMDVLVSYFAEQGAVAIQKARTSNYKKKLRILQFFIAHALKIAFVSRIKREECKLLHEIICRTFGKAEAEIILSDLENIEEKNKVKYISKEKVKADDMGYKTRFHCDMFWKADDEEGFAINQALYQGIQYGYETRELPSREAIKSPAKHFLRNYETIAVQLKRLQQGLSLKALEEIIEDAGDFYQLEHVVSLFIDRGVDEGIIVPTIYYSEEGHYSCRVYRHGEDLPFGDADKSRLLCFLKHLDANFRRLNGDQEEMISSVSFEKMLVFFYQIGMQKKFHIFNRFLGFDNYPVLKQRFSVHGAVGTYKEEDTEEESHVYLERNDRHTLMLNAYLSGANHFIKINGKKKNICYIIQSNNINNFLITSKLNNISRNIDEQIERIASVISAWYWLEHTKPKNTFRDDITALTSCKDIFTYASTAATSIHYFKEYWEGEAKGKLIQIQQGNNNQNFYSESFDPVLPSARDKYGWFQEGKAFNVIKQVSKKLEDAGERENRIAWKSFWNDKQPNWTGVDLRQDADIATQYIYFYSACYEWLRQKWFLRDDVQDSFLSRSKSVAKYLEKCKSIKTGYDDVLNYFKLFDSLLDTENKSDRIKNFLVRMDGILNQSEEIVTRIEEGIRANSASYRIRYSSVIVVDIEFQESNFANEFFLEIWDDISETQKKTHINIVFLDVVEEQYFRFGIFHEQHDEDAIRYLLTIYDSIHLFACKYACKTRTILIPMLRDSWVFNHDLKSNISKYVKDFMAKVSTLLDRIQFRGDYVHQFSFIQTWTTERILRDEIKDSLKKYGYEELEEIQIIVVPSLEAKFDCYHFVCGKFVETSKLNYSTVLVEVNGDPKGTGILFCYEEEIYCVTCQHLLWEKNFSGRVQAVLDSSQQRIHLKPINYIEKTNRVAWEDVLILKPDITKLPELDRKYMFHVEDCVIDDSQALKEDSYTLYGFGLSDLSFGRLVQNIQLNGLVHKYYCQMKGTSDLGPGDSGAAIISDKTLKLLGVHAKSFDRDSTQSLMIPAKIVLDVLGRVYNKREV